MSAENGDCYIEFCINCSQHLWCSWHKEERYLQFFQMTSDAIKRVNPQVQVFANVVPPEMRDKFYTDQDNREDPIGALGKTKWPRIGAFEVYYKGKLLSSKLASKTWPSCATVAARVSGDPAAFRTTRSRPKTGAARSRIDTSPSRTQQTEEMTPTRSAPKVINKEEMKREEAPRSQTPNVIIEPEVVPAEKVEVPVVIPESKQKKAEEPDFERVTEPVVAQLPPEVNEEAKITVEEVKPTNAAIPEPTAEAEAPSEPSAPDDALPEPAETTESPAQPSESAPPANEEVKAETQPTEPVVAEGEVAPQAPVEAPPQEPAEIKEDTPEEAKAEAEEANPEAIEEQKNEDT